MTEKAQIMPMLMAAVRGAQDLPPPEKADVFEGIAVCSASIDPTMAEQAKSLADALRDSEALQRHFLNLLMKTSA